MKLAVMLFSTRNMHSSGLKNPDSGIFPFYTLNMFVSVSILKSELASQDQGKLSLQEG